MTFIACEKIRMSTPYEPPLSCSQEACETDEEKYLKFFLNGACTVTSYASLSKSSLGLYLEGGLPFSESIGHGLSVTIHQGVNLNDTIWLSNTALSNPLPNSATAVFFYVEDDTYAGDFKFAEEVIDPESYLLIDEFNVDTTSLVGRFQGRFTERSVNAFVGAPDTLRLSCGSFRVSI